MSGMRVKPAVCPPDFGECSQGTPVYPANDYNAVGRLKIDTQLSLELEDINVATSNTSSNASQIG